MNKEPHDTETRAAMPKVKWLPVGVAVEGEPVYLQSENAWTHKWRSLNVAVDLYHPRFPYQRHALTVYQIDSEGGTILFAAGELSAGAWAFFVAPRL